MQLNNKCPVCEKEIPVMAYTHRPGFYSVSNSNDWVVYCKECFESIAPLELIEMLRPKEKKLEPNVNGDQYYLDPYDAKITIK